MENINWKWEVNSSSPEWKRLVNHMVNGGEKDEFAKLTKMYGKAYLHYLEVSYYAKDNLSDKLFCKYNGKVPVSFLKKLKHGE